MEWFCVAVLTSSTDTRRFRSQDLNAGLFQNLMWRSRSGRIKFSLEKWGIIYTFGIILLLSYHISLL